MISRMTAVRQKLESYTAEKSKLQILGNKYQRKSDADKVSD